MKILSSIQNHPSIKFTVIGIVLEAKKNAYNQDSLAVHFKTRE